MEWRRENGIINYCACFVVTVDVHLGTMVSLPPDLAMASPLTDSMTEGLSQLTSSSLGITLSSTTLTTYVESTMSHNSIITTVTVVPVLSSILIIVVISLVVVCLSFKRIRRSNQANAAVHTVTMTNEAYGVVLQDMTTSGEDSAYSYPSVDPVSSLSIEARQNEAYATNVAAQRNVAYGANTVTTGESHEFGMYDYNI